MTTNQKVFYENIKIVIDSGQYYLEDMTNKLTKAYAKDLLNDAQYDELISLAKTKVDNSYEKTKTVEELIQQVSDLEERLAAQQEATSMLMLEVYNTENKGE